MFSRLFDLNVQFFFPALQGCNSIHLLWLQADFLLREEAAEDTVPEVTDLAPEGSHGSIDFDDATVEAEANAPVTELPLPPVPDEVD